MITRNPMQLKAFVVGDGTKTPTEDDTINQISAETYSQRQHKE